MLTQDSVIELENSLLDINFHDVSENGTDYVSYLWFKKIDGVKVPNLSVTLYVTEYGIVNKFSNNLPLYTIVDTEDLISEEQAILLAQPYIDEYANEEDRKVVNIEAEFRYSRDFKCCRGDSYTIYPEWAISANFSELSKEGVYGYSVLVWADTGKLHSSGIQGTFMDENMMNEALLHSLVLIITGILVACTLLVSIAIYRHKKILARN